MMMQGKKFKYGLFFMLAVLLAYPSCQKVINLKLNNAASQLVIEGNLTDVQGPQYVVISKSIPFSAKDDFPGVSNAVVTITDSTGIPKILTERQAGQYVINAYKGTYGKTYTLTVKVGDDVYTATSTMPYPVPLDSVTAKSDDFGKKNLRTVVVNYHDPADTANQYRFILSINSNQVSTIFANDDSFISGRSVTEELFQTGTDIHSGDTASVEMQSIDKNMYKYWYSLSQQQNNGPGGGVTPSNPPSNFNNGALGYFSVHTTGTKAIVIN
jgi:hypothetical protein